MCPINPITNAKPVYSSNPTCDNVNSDIIQMCMGTQSDYEVGTGFSLESRKKKKKKKK
jgi:hypothetical protein